MRTSCRRRFMAANVQGLEQQDGWAQIRTADDYTGWTPLPALRSRPPYAAEARRPQVQSLFAHIYREASVTKHAPLITVPFETQARSERPSPRPKRRWLQVRLPDDRTGWIQPGDVAFELQETEHPRDARLRQAISRPALHVGRHVELRLRLLGLRPDARPAPRNPYAARCAAAGRLERRSAGGAPRTCSPATCCTSAARRRRSPTPGSISAEGQVHQRHDTRNSDGSHRRS